MVSECALCQSLNTVHSMNFIALPNEQYEHCKCLQLVADIGAEV